MSKKFLIYISPIIVFFCVVIGVHLYFSGDGKKIPQTPIEELLTAPETTTSTAETTTSSTTTSTTLTTTSTTTTISTTTTTAVIVTDAVIEETEIAEEAPVNEAPPEEPSDAETPDTAPVAPSYTAVGVSPNSQFYQERLVVAGDSIASGYYYYGYIPEGHNLAQSSLSIWNFEYFTFNVGGTLMNISDGINALQPKLVLFSVGMNDINCTSAETYTEKYRSKIEIALQQDPDVNIVVSGITPIATYVTYTTNDSIRQYNAALKAMVDGMGSSRVYYFDPFPVLADPATNALKDNGSSGDGMHLAASCYGEVLSALFNYLDTTPVYEQIVKAEQ